MAPYFWPRDRPRYAVARVLRAFRREARESSASLQASVNGLRSEPLIQDWQGTADEQRSVKDDRFSSENRAR